MVVLRVLSGFGWRSSLVELLLFGACAALGACSQGTVKKGPETSEVPLAVELGPQDRARVEATGRRAIVSTQGVGATRAAERILARGGNLIDAAVAASFAISVERPHSTGLAGGGFLLYRETKSGKTYAVDFRERAPLAATRTMYLDARGEVIPRASIDGIRAVAVPGLVAGLAEIHQRFGKLPFRELLAPAIELAEKGFEVYPDLARALLDRKAVLAGFPASAAIFLKPGGEPYAVGDRLVQKDLAKTLRLIAVQGKRAFYRGEISRAIVAESKRRGGILSEKDFASYQVKWREPVKASFRDHLIWSMPPPSSGGTHLIEILNIVEKEPLAGLGMLSADSIHRVASAMQLAFADRATYMGDPDFVDVPLRALVSKRYAAKQRARIRDDRHLPSEQVQAGQVQGGGTTREESPDTTHLSILDAEGNAVATTQTINGWMGSGFVVPGTGLVLNNEMDDFAAKPGVANLYGAVGGDANAIAPLKTPLSSMSPTIVTGRNGQPVLVLGAPGGTRIINCVAQTILNYLVYRQPLYESIAAVRFHHQWTPDELKLERPGPGGEVIARLEKMGHRIAMPEDAVHCRVMAVAREGEVLRGVSDPRDAGSSAGL